MRVALQELTEQYSAALREYCTEGGEASLLRGYQLGRRAVAAGLGVLEMSTLHQEALVEALLEMLARDGSAHIATRASEFFAECLAPFELTRCSIQEAHAAMCDDNRGLKQRLSAALSDFVGAQDELLEEKRLSNLKTDFISVISHEVRTPLTSIHGALNLLLIGLGGEFNPKGQRLMDVAYRNSRRLMRFVNDVLELQRMELGTMTLDMRPCELQSLLEQSVEASQAYASQLGIRLVLKQVPAGVRVRVDADRTMQVMANLLSNAIKFSPTGETVSVEASRHGSVVRVAVIDHGPGVPQAFRSRIFQKFSQAERSSEREGSGLGLSITKAIVEQLGGRVGFESEVGCTTFYFDFLEWGPQPASLNKEEDTWAADR
jgi:signal transduction histidine kinase